MRRRVAWFAAITIVLAACNSITGLSDDYRLGDDDGGADPDTGTNVPDSTIEDDGATTSDAGVDVADTSTPDAAGQDADAAPDAPPSTFCADAGATVVFCTDFEEANPLAKWDNAPGQIKGGNGQISIVAGAGIGGSKAYRAFASEAATDRTVAMWKAISNTPSSNSRYTATFSFLIKKKTIEYGVFGALGFVPTFSPYYGLATYPNGNLDQSDPPAPSTGLTAPGTLDVWHTATIVLERVGAGPGFNGKIIVNGQTIDDARPLNAGAATSTELRLGYLFTSADPGEAEVFYDNVIVFRDP